MERTNISPDRIQSLLESFGPNAGLVEELLEAYVSNPASVSESWQHYFDSVLNGGSPPPPEPAPSPEKTRKRPEPPAPKDSQQATILRGVAAKIVENMEASLALPTATSVRTMPVKVLEENRRLLNQYLADRRGIKISYTHIIAYAIVRALEDFPNLNASFARIDGVPHKTEGEKTNIGLAIDLPRKDGTRSLVVPNVKDADQLDFAAFVEKYEDIVKRARESALDPSDFLGTSITLTNPGTVGTIASIPRLMPGQGAIIATGAINLPSENQGMAAETLSSLGLSKVMTMTCTYDHRVIQGAESGQFLGRINSFLLGEERFFDNLFADLSIPFEPVRWSPDRRSGGLAPSGLDEIEKQARVLQLINAYRVRGHLIAHLDPLVDEPQRHSELDPGSYGLTLWDLDRKFVTGGLGGNQSATLREIRDIVRKTYCGTTGVEYMNIQDPDQKEWLQKKMEPTRNSEPLPDGRRKQILHKLTSAEGLEKFLHARFIGHKRFSLEGAETLMPILDVLLDDAADNGVQEVVIGMAHRGRLNVLANTIGKSLAKIFSEFEGYVDPASTQGTGDVKYHLGASGTHRTPGGKEISVSLAPNPSHLEAVNPVVEGGVRAKQDRFGDRERDRVIPLLIHGDAAFAGQGVVAETLNLSQLAGYRTGGTIHLIINNQIGFTTLPDDARSSPYCTDVAKMVQAPIFHVNGDDPDACVRVTRLALEYRQRFKKDVVIDMICYRRHGHNEGDEPSYTQPLLYRKIKQHSAVRELYAEQLERDTVLSRDEIDAISENSRQRYERAFEASQKREMRFKPEVPLAVSSEDLERKDAQRSSFISQEILDDVARAMENLPSGFNIHRKLLKLVKERSRMLEGPGTIDWAYAEALAFGSLVCQGTPVRLSGQDSGRGTFSQRHLILYDAERGEEYVPLNNIRDDQAPFSVYDSLLSEEAVLGFEFGYSVADPLALVLWEAQFGDFVNGAQIIIDQFIAGAESKWSEVSSLVLLLPHGYEGQGPEHSSARLERFLQLCAENNLQVCNCTTPAQYFHLLRRQMVTNRRQPLVIMTPKSLLRHPEATSRTAEILSGGFQEVIDDDSSGKATEVRRVILCSGKLFYDLRKEKEIPSTMRIVRVEQFYPYPAEQLEKLMKKYHNAGEIVWAQEEPLNMGGWTYMQPRLGQALRKGQTLSVVGRPAAASSATGSQKTHFEEQSRIVEKVFS